MGVGYKAEYTELDCLNETISLDSEGDKIRHMTKIRNAGWAMKALGGTRLPLEPWCCRATRLKPAGPYLLQ